MLGDVRLFAHLGKRDLRRIARAAKVVRVPAGRCMVREKEGDCFGELGLLDGEARTASVLADSDLWAVKIPRQSFLDLVDHHPTIARGLLAALTERLRVAEARAAGPR